MFPGNTNDASTVKAQIEKVRNRFGLDCVVWVGDKGMLTSLVIKEEPEELSLDESRVLKYRLSRTCGDKQNLSFIGNREQGIGNREESVTLDTVLHIMSKEPLKLNYSSRQGS